MEIVSKMSLRALRKLQREEEEQKQIRLQEQAEDDESEEEQASAPKALNTFDMLNANEDEEGSEPSNDKEEDISQAEAQQVDASTTMAAKSKQKKSKKKKKNKKKEKETEAALNEDKTPPAEENQLDEIDLALKSLSTKSKAGSGFVPETVPLIDPAHTQLNALLAVESKHLNALNEMKRLFGNVVLENEDESPGTPRRRGRGPQQLDLGGALAARNSPVARGQGLTGIALRRNFLIQGKEEWPKAAGGGLGMELVERLDDGTIEYRFVHNKIYQDVQRQFMSCVESMDPQRMISMLVYNPYHVSTLLQVSEIAKQQGDHSVSGDLLERALFTFGRSVHSSFTNAISEGKARLNFERPENREFWLAAWRYMNNLGQRGTWRTAYEWAKLILSLDPELDPYCIHKIMDQLALRGGQPEHFIELSKCSSLLYNEDIWQRCPNIAISSALAEYRLKKAQECRASLKKSIEDYPWIFARLFQELGLDHIPKSIWGTTPRTPREKLDCESYVIMAKDLWNTPEAISLLVEVASYALPPKTPILDDRPITLDEARHAVLSGIPAVIDCIPRSFTNQSTSSFDPFPPTENLPSYNTHATRVIYVDGDEEDDTDNPPLPPNLDHLEVDPATAQRTDVRGLQSFFSRFIPWLGRSEAETGENDASAAPGPSNEMEAAIAASAREAHEAGLPAAEIQERGNRLLEVLGQATPRVLTGQGPDGQYREDPEGSNRPLLDMLLANAREAGPTEPNSTPRAAIEAETDTVQQPSGADTTNSGRQIASPVALTPAASHEMTGLVRARNAAEASGDTESADTLTQQINDIAIPVAPRRTNQPSVNDGSEEENEEDNHTTSPVARNHQLPDDSLYDDDRNQRWLAGQGILRLKDYTAQHSTDPSGWRNDGVGRELLTEYASRILALQRERSRRFILDYALRQGAGGEVGELVEREVAKLRQERGAA